ncbi:hypothetical protein TPA0909_29640 [Streptomyces albus]|nr:hypothetical protein TPA0909_29640 [Streptomyces albus]
MAAEAPAAAIITTAALVASVAKARFAVLRMFVSSLVCQQGPLLAAASIGEPPTRWPDLPLSRTAGALSGLVSDRAVPCPGQRRRPSRSLVPGHRSVPAARAARLRVGTRRSIAHQRPVPDGVTA